MAEKDITQMEEENLTEEKQIDEEEATDTSDAPIEESSEEEMNDLVQEIENLKQEKEELYQRFLRTQAEFDNFKKRSQKEKEADRKYKAQDLVTELLPAIDNFERALQVEVTDENKNLLDGISMVYRQLVEALKSQGVEIIEAVGKEFDPNLHQAVMQVEDDNFESNIVVEDLQKGYLIKDRVIRPAMVKVNK
ncbi:protein GrpE [Ornithinibacillus bavariensis]|uniref:Protein GrpE n=2 Tax=Ornithinibacillus bavariensis TaxID=545502 RepID=A0A920C6A8_9BACI|nr:protein GrpE [Ornithinibacillus bavariensis]